MNPEGGIWRDFHLDENCVRVDDEHRARLYLAQISLALDGLREAAAAETSTTNAESQALDGFAQRLRSTFEILALRHFYTRDGSELKIDATASGFFHFSTLLELASDLERRDALLAALPDRAALRRDMLDRIVTHDLHPREQQEQMARRLYLEALAAERLFRRFLPGPLVKVGQDDDVGSHFWSFASFDAARNLPFLYLLYFELDGARRALAESDREFVQLREHAERIARGGLDLLGFSNRLDHELPRIKPRIVKRVVLGPYLAPAFTRCEGALGSLLEQHAERGPYALCFETETLVSARETRVGAGWLSRGQLRQVFWIPDDLDLAGRGASQVERAVLLPHWLAAPARNAGVAAERRILAVTARAEAAEGGARGVA